MSRLLTIAFIIGMAIAMFPPVSSAHPGGTNAQGCHTNRKTGDYHCHTARTPPPGRVTYCHVINGQSRCGYSKTTCDELVDEFGGYCRKD